jgi:hypothetical protein
VGAEREGAKERRERFVDSGAGRDGEGWGGKEISGAEMCAFRRDKKRAQI